MLPLRKLLRLVLSVFILTLLWVRIARQWRYESNWWLAGTLTLSLLLLLLVIFLVTSVFRKPRNPRDEVPKRPLGLDS
jgi:ABC-type spermidine/putrescine transport system permease subunit I